MIQRGNESPTGAIFSVNLNIVLTGSKKMSPEQQEALLKVDTIHVVISDASDPTSILLETEAYAKEFSTGSVGYGINERGLAFEQV